MEGEIASPVVVGSALGLGHIGRVFDDDALVETARHIAWAEVHLADVDAPVAAVGQILHPVAMIGPVVEAVGPRVVGVHAGEDGGAAGNAGCARTIGLAERDALPGDAIHVWRDHVVVTPAGDGIEALLVGHDQDNVRFFWQHNGNPNLNDGPRI